MGKKGAMWGKGGGEECSLSKKRLVRKKADAHDLILKGEAQREERTSGKERDTESERKTTVPRPRPVSSETDVVQRGTVEPARRKKKGFGKKKGDTVQLRSDPEKGTGHSSPTPLPSGNRLEKCALKHGVG